MIRSRPIAIALALALIPAACAEQAPEGEPAEDAAATPAADVEAQVEAFRAEWVTHYNLHHPDMVADLYTDDATVLGADLSVAEGRDAVAASLAAAMESSPTVSVTTRDVMAFGDRAVSIGTYSVDAEIEGEPASWSGSYLNLLVRVDGDWRMAGLIANYDSPRPEGWNWAEIEEGAPSEGSAMTSLIEEFETHWNLGHPDMVADFYTQDAVGSFAGAPFLSGRDAIAESARGAMEAGAVMLDVHGVSTMELDADHRIDSGWYELLDGEDGEPVQMGYYANLVERAEDGNWQIRWAVTNGRPMGGM